MVLPSAPSGARPAPVGGIDGSWTGSCGSSVRPHLIALIRNRRFGRAAADLAIYFLAHRRFAFRAIFRGTKRVVQRDSNEAGVCPDWLDEEFANRLGLQQRWAELAGRAGRSGHGRTAFGEGDDGSSGCR